METSINNQLGRITAETPNINPNSNPETENHMPHHHTEVVDQDDTPISLKTNAERFLCYIGTLKNKVKNGSLPALQESPKAPYLVKPSDVERLLRETPGIASVFHPAESQPPSDANNETPQPKPDEAAPASASAAKCEPVFEPKTDTPATGDVLAHVGPPGAIARSDLQGVNGTAQAPEISQSSHPRKRRRRNRGRGRGKSGAEPSNPSGVHSLALKALNGSSPEERLRITACLNELASLVASA